MICALCREQTFSSYGYRFFDSTALKVGLVALGLLSVGGGVAAYLLQVNTTASYSLIGGGGFLTAVSVLSFIQYPRGKGIPQPNRNASSA